MKELIKKVVKVPVANIWTTKESPRKVDSAFLSDNENIVDWIGKLASEEKVELCERELLQTQVLYGEIVNVHEETDNWCYVTIPAQYTVKNKLGYPGWLPKKLLGELAMDRDMNFAATAITIKKKVYLFNNRNERFLEISFNTKLPVMDTDGEWIEVWTPHGRKWLKRDDVSIIDPNSSFSTNQENILATAKMFLGLPYLWGGISSYGFDCSGMVYAIFSVNGFIIPRDADDQAQIGITITPEEIQPGDLLFFAKTRKEFIHHVGIYYGEDKMLHTSLTGGKVEVISLKGTKYEKELVRRKRILMID